MTAQHTLVLAIDGLRASALGAYGNTWRPTPALDKLACDSLLCEWAFTASPDPLDLYRSFASHSSLWRKKRLITDDPAVAQHSSVAWFDEAVGAKLTAATQQASDLASTSLAGSFSAFADELQEFAAASSEGPALTVIHCQGLSGAWDAPTGLIAQFVDEEDPMPAEEVTPAFGEINRERDHDAIFTAGCRYAAQIAVLDACLEGFLEVVDHAFPQEPPIVALVGLRGYALGEHGWIGVEDRGPYVESRHVPLLLRTPNPAPNRRWNQAPMATSQLAALLASLAAGGGDSPEERLASQVSTPLMLQGEEKIALRNLDWCLIQPKTGQDATEAAGDCELYVKPDDRWESNDIASLRTEVVQEISAASRIGENH